MTVSSDDVGLDRLTAGQAVTCVCVSRTLSAIAWSRSHLIRHWLGIALLAVTIG